MQAVNHQFDARRDAQFVEHLQKVISHDVMMSRGWSARVVAFACMGITVVAGGLARLSLKLPFPRNALIEAAGFGLLLVVSIHLRWLRPMTTPPAWHRAQSGDALSE